MKIQILILLFTSLVFAQKPLDKDSDHAVKETQKLLIDPKRRQEALKDPKANQANKDLQKLTGGDAQIDQEIWELAADLMPLLASEGNGDPKNMLQFLENMKRNPAAFASKFTPEQQAKLKAIADKIQKAQKKNP